MISVRNLTKRFGQVVAVDRASFEVESGEVVGFLGPNGAGKSTTLRILTGFISATEGSAEVAGLDVLSQSLQVRERVGYLPENVPLYLDMRVNEYLQFRGRLKGLPRKDAVERAEQKMEMCGLSEMRRRIVGHLSKGYRQRVGLADAMISDPDVLILDEPTAGLDPAQRKDVRDLIARLREKHTILLSSHILGEVESISDRVVIIQKGKIRARGTKAELASQLGLGGRLRVETDRDAATMDKSLDGLDGFRRVSSEDVGNGFHAHLLDLEGDQDLRASLVSHLVKDEVAVREVRWQGLSLEEAYLQLTAESAMDVAADAASSKEVAS